MTTDFTPDEAEEQLGSRLDDAIPTHGYASVPVVAIGASASALPQLQTMLQGLPQQCGMSFVVVRHDPPGTEASEDWSEAMRSATAMQVVPLESSVRIQPDTLYLVPPERGARAIDGALLPTDGEPEHGRMVIDLFLRSLADTHGAHSAAVVLSGSGADGAIGIKRVKERGGLTWRRTRTRPCTTACRALPSAPAWSTGCCPPTRCRGGCWRTSSSSRN